LTDVLEELIDLDRKWREYIQCIYGQTMKTQIAKWGNSLAVRIPKAAAQAANLKAGDNLDLDVGRAGSLTLRKKKRRPTLKELLRGITPENRHPETDWGERVGNEEW
jgi:antitoxin MazE